MPSRESVIRDLRTQVERTDGRTERECGTLLEHIAWVLLAPIEGQVIYVNTEQRSSAGSVDFVVMAERTVAGGQQYQEAYVWELKAPQVNLFKLETRDRARPSEHLYGAENQLLHYHHALARDGQFRSRWNIISPEHVRLGGIVIGRDGNLVQCEPEEITRGEAVASQARDIRDIYFYRHHHLSLFTWDTVLSLVESHTASHQRIVGPDRAMTDVSASRPSAEFVYTEPPSTEPPE